MMAYIHYQKGNYNYEGETCEITCKGIVGTYMDELVRCELLPGWIVFAEVSCSSLCVATKFLVIKWRRYPDDIDIMDWSVSNLWWDEFDPWNKGLPNNVDGVFHLCPKESYIKNVVKGGNAYGKYPEGGWLNSMPDRYLQRWRDNLIRHGFIIEGNKAIRP